MGRQELQPRDFWRTGTRGFPDNRENRWLWWPIRVSLNRRSLRSMLRYYMFTRHGVESHAAVEVLEADFRSGYRTVKDIHYYVQCLHLGPLTFVLGEGIREKQRSKNQGVADG